VVLENQQIWSVLIFPIIQFPGQGFTNGGGMDRHHLPSFSGLSLVFIFPMSYTCPCSFYQPSEITVGSENIGASVVPDCLCAFCVNRQ
jgi:hypothetical protein